MPDDTNDTYALFDGIRGQRRTYVITENFSDIPEQNRPYARKTAGILGRQAAAPYHHLGLPKVWRPVDYVTFVIGPIYAAGGCGTGLYEWWVKNCSRSRVADPRVKEFLKEAQEMTDLKG